MFSHLTEEVPRQLFLQHSLLCDEVEEILARLGSLHDDDEAVVSLEEVEQLDNAINTSNSLHQTNLQRNLLQTNLKDENK